MTVESDEYKELFLSPEVREMRQRLRRERAEREANGGAGGGQSAQALQAHAGGRANAGDGGGGFFAMGDGRLARGLVRAALCALALLALYSALPRLRHAILAAYTRRATR